MNSFQEIEYYRGRYPEACLLIDTNILLLYLVGVYDPTYVKSCPLMTNNNRNYDERHFGLLKNILTYFTGKLYITPHVLPEIWSLSDKHIKRGEMEFERYFKSVLKELQACHEYNVGITTLITRGAEIIKFGFTDTGLVVAAQANGWCILTDEGRLHRTYEETLAMIYFQGVVARELYALPTRL